MPKAKYKRILLKLSGEIFGGKHKFGIDPEIMNLIADEIKKYGGFIPGIRPGKNTRDYLQATLYRLTFIGAIFLGIIAVLPNILSGLTGARLIFFGGTSILIVVSVILETYKVVQAQLTTANYDKLQSLV